MVRIEGQLPTREQIQASLAISRRIALTRLAAGMGSGVLIAITGGKILENYSKNTMANTPPKPETLKPRIILGPNLIFNPTLEPSDPSSTNPYQSPTGWMFTQDGTNARVVKNARIVKEEKTPSGSFPVEIEGYYDDNGFYHKPFLESLNPLSINLTNPFSEYELSFRAKVQSPRNQPLVFVVPIQPLNSPNKNYEEMADTILFQPKVQELGQWTKEPFRLRIHRDNFPAYTPGIILKFTIGDTDNNIVDKSNRGVVRYGDISFNEVINPLKNMPSTSM